MQQQVELIKSLILIIIEGETDCLGLKMSNFEQFAAKPCSLIIVITSLISLIS